MKLEVSPNYPTHPVRGCLTVGLIFMYTERCIDSDIFCRMNQKDLAIIFPQDNQFIIGVKLYQLIQKMRKRVPTADFDFGHTSQDSDVASVLISKTSSAQASVETLSRANTSSASFRSGGECSDGNLQENLLCQVEGRRHLA